MKDYNKFWDKISSIEEEDFDDEKINRALRMREIENNLQGVKNILDIGGGTGAFSIPLARKGYSVTHFDISEKMINKAKENAKGINNIRFIKSDAKDLSVFSDNEFDLVLNLDGAISFSGKNANKVIEETCRVGKRAILSVSNKACMTATWLNYSLSAFNNIHKSVKDMMVNGYFNKENYDDCKGLTYINELKSFSIKELTGIIEDNNMNVKECRSLGSLTHLYLMQLYSTLDKNEVKKKIDEISESEEFLELCDYYDKEIMSEGMGSFRRAGIIAVCEKDLVK